jgi:hypothetical protein
MTPQLRKAIDNASIKAWGERNSAFIEADIEFSQALITSLLDGLRLKGEGEYSEGWNACLLEVKRRAGVPLDGVKEDV